MTGRQKLIFLLLCVSISTLLVASNVVFNTHSFDMIDVVMVIFGIGPIAAILSIYGMVKSNLDDGGSDQIATDERADV